MKAIKAKQQAESTIFKELERICRIIVEKKVDVKDIELFRQQIKYSLDNLYSIREANEIRAEKRKEMRALNKRLTEIDNEISRLVRIKAAPAMIIRMQSEREKVAAQL